MTRMTRMNLSFLITSRVLVAALLGLAAADTALAQFQYRCGAGRSAYVSTEPCPSSRPPHIVRNFGPVPERSDSTGHTHAPRLARAPDTLNYLSPRCAQLNDAIRTAPTRGLKHPEIADLRSDYDQTCREDEQRARRRIEQDKGAQRARTLEAEAEASAVASQQRRSAEQCSDLLGILAGKRKRVAAMTPGERSDFELFESNYRSRCKG